MMTRRVQRSIGVLGLVVSLAIASACSTKDAVETGLLALQSAAITANATTGPNGQPLLATADAMHVVTYTTQALTTLSAGASGWQAQVQTGWSQFVSDLPAAVKAQFSTTIAVISGAIGGL